MLYMYSKMFNSAPLCKAYSHHNDNVILLIPAKLKKDGGSLDTKSMWYEGSTHFETAVIKVSLVKPLTIALDP